MRDTNSKPDNNMVWAILSTFFCCLPLGIVSIINASKVDSLYRSGEYEAAYEAANNAKKYARWGAIIGVLSFVLIIIFEVFVIGIASFSSNNDNSLGTEYEDPIEYADADTVAVYDESDGDYTDFSNLSLKEAREAIEKDVITSNNDCPFEADEGIMITSIKMNGNNIVYKAECDEDYVSIQSLKMNKKTLKDEIISALKEDNENFITLLKEGNVGLIYKYIGDQSEDVCTVMIEPSDL